MPRILLINPPIRTTSPPKHIPYGIAQIAAVLDEAGFEVGILDVNATRVGFDVLRAEIKQEPSDYDYKAWDWIGIGGLITTYKWLEDAMMHIVKAKEEHTAIVVGGGLASSIPEHLLKWLPEIDVGVLGEGERTIIEFTKLYDQNKGDLHTLRQELHTIDGIVYKDNITAPRQLMTEEELDELPYPAWDLLPLDIYFQHSPLDLAPEAMMARRRLDVISQRGCTGKCVFCFHNMLSDDTCRMRMQSADYVIDMIKHMRFKYSIDFVSFLDENMTARPSRLDELCNGIEDSGLHDMIRWGCLGRPDQLNQFILKRMKEVGCVYISMGGESANDTVLKNIGKHTKSKQIAKAIHNLFRAEINPVCTFMTSYPKEYCDGYVVDEMIETTEFWERHNIQCRPFLITPYPKTELFEEFKDRVLQQYEWAEDPMREFVKNCGDATKLIVNLTNELSDVEILGLREMMISHDTRRLKQFRDDKYGSRTKQDAE